MSNLILRNFKTYLKNKHQMILKNGVISNNFDNNDIFYANFF